MSQIRANAPMIPSPQAYANCRTAFEDDHEIDLATARTVAGWWACPRGVGSILAQLSQGLPVLPALLLIDISATRMGSVDLSPADKLALDMLSTWAISQGRVAA